MKTQKLIADQSINKSFGRFIGHSVQSMSRTISAQSLLLFVSAFAHRNWADFSYVLTITYGWVK